METDSIKTRRERAELAMKENRWTDAVNDLRTVHEHEPQNFTVWAQLGFALSRNEQYADAIGEFSALAEKQPTDPKWPYSVGFQYYQQKDWARAIDCFSKALALRPGYVKVLYRKGYAHVSLGQEQDAIQAFLSCISSWEKLSGEVQDRDRSAYGKAQFQMGKLYLKKGLSLKARRHLEIAAQIHSGDHDVLYELGQCHLKNDRVDDAVQVLKAADQIKPGTDYILDRLAQAYMKKHDYDSAEAIYKRIPDRRRRPFVLQHLGMMYLEQGDPQKALPLLETAAKRQADNHNIHYALGAAQEAAGQLQAAQASYGRAVSFRKAKFNLPFKEAEEALQRMTEHLATLPAQETAEGGHESESEGLIETYNESRGFGFISSKSQARLFFHVSSVLGRRKPCQGARVSFLSETSPKGPRAVQVKLLSA